MTEQLGNDKVIPTVDVELGGKVFQVRCSFGVLIDYQKLTGKNPFKAEFLSELGPEDMLNLLYCSLKRVDASITREFVEENMVGAHMQTVGKIINGLFDKAMPTPEKSEGDSNEEKKA